MNEKRICELADFFYSSDSSNDVPLRIASTTGQFSGFELCKESFIELMKILNKSKSLKEDLSRFREEHNE